MERAGKRDAGASAGGQETMVRILAGAGVRAKRARFWFDDGDRSGQSDSGHSSTNQNQLRFRRAGYARFPARYFSQSPEKYPKALSTGSAPCRGFRRAKPAFCTRAMAWLIPAAGYRGRSESTAKPGPIRSAMAQTRKRLRNGGTSCSLLSTLRAAGSGVVSWHPKSMNPVRVPVWRLLRCRQPHCMPPALKERFCLLFRRL